MRRELSHIVLIATVFLLAVVSISPAKIIRVDDDADADFGTIQAAIDAAEDNDTVLIAPGTYTGDGNRDIDFKGKEILVRSQDGPETCVIDCQSPTNSGLQTVHLQRYRGVHFHSGEGSGSILQGVTITGGSAPGNEPGGGILCDGASPRIVDCVLRGNRARRGGGIGLVKSAAQLERVTIVNNTAADGGGIGYGYNRLDASTALFVRCVVAGNHAEYHPRYGGEGGGVLVEGYARFVNCLIVGNRAGYRGGGISSRMFEQSCSFENCIVWGNEQGLELYGDGHQVSTSSSHGAIYVSNTVIQDEGQGEHISDPEQGLHGNWFSSDPCFVQPGRWESNGTPDSWLDDVWVDGDYHLQSQAGHWDSDTAGWVVDDLTSPCIDAGDPNSPIMYEPFPNGGAINIGAYGGTLEASKSYFGTPLCETIIAGDINGDCKVDFEDLAILMRHWLQSAGQMPD